MKVGSKICFDDPDDVWEVIRVRDESEVPLEEREGYAERDFKEVE